MCLASLVRWFVIKGYQQDTKSASNAKHWGAVQEIHILERPPRSSCDISLLLLSSFFLLTAIVPSLNHFKTCISSLQILGKPLLEEFQIQWPLDGAILKENAGKGCFWGSVLWPPDSTQTSSKELCTSTRLNPGTSHLFGSLRNQDPEVYI